eukprot:CAMPEP_0114129724 /NCGR_PEP_ID=MMETSP0043_2-20121206/11627_1 /TAXON_ID=464988 /ORGANISM="Hemiselmis andersenii, Strain CCMP644" /LENGTH=57 /DNA_ID=CAMNT_0001223017 /DNA_START=31 /DNA_END=204 /DNA_ORIENTATION=-
MSFLRAPMTSMRLRPMRRSMAICSGDALSGIAGGLFAGDCSSVSGVLCPPAPVLVLS